MKKGWLFLLLALFPISVNAEDKLVIDNYDVYITVLGENSYYYYNTLSIKTTYGENPYTYYMRVTIPNKGPYEYRDKVLYYDTELNNFDFKTTQNHFNLYDDNNYVVGVGSDTRLFKKEDIVKMSYDIKQNGSKLQYIKDLNFVLLNSDYDINKATFKIVLPENSEEYITKFSLDGENYYRSMENLEYTYEGNVIDGNYNKKISAENSIYVRLESNKIVVNYKEVVVCISLISVLLSVLYISNRYLKNLNIYRKSK